MSITRALISVSDKKGVVEFNRAEKGQETKETVGYMDTERFPYGMRIIEQAIEDASLNFHLIDQIATR